MCARLGIMLTVSSSGYNSAMLQVRSCNRGIKDVSCPCLSGLEKTEKASETGFLYTCRDGCHHCGTRMGRVIGDHIPPNKYVGSAEGTIKQIADSLGVTKPSQIAPFGKLR